LQAQFVVDTGGTLSDTYAQVEAVLAALAHTGGAAYYRHWAQ
jgi:hypothetical protein